MFYAWICLVCTSLHTVPATRIPCIRTKGTVPDLRPHNMPPTVSRPLCGHKSWKWHWIVNLAAENINYNVERNHHLKPTGHHLHTQKHRPVEKSKKYRKSTLNFLTVWSTCTSNFTLKYHVRRVRKILKWMILPWYTTKFSEVIFTGGYSNLSGEFLFQAGN